MRKKGRIYQLAIALLLCFLQMAGIAMYGQDRPRAASKRAQRHQTDTLNTVVNRDSLTVADSLAAENKPRPEGTARAYRQSAKGHRPQKVGT